MCLVKLDFRPEQIILEVLREEYYARPTRPLHLWPNGIWAGQDMLAHGTWFGVRPPGRWAVVTNIPTAPSNKSRGLLPIEFLQGYWEHPPDPQEYAGFNLLLGDAGRVFYCSSHAPGRHLTHGIYLLGNAPLELPDARTLRAQSENLIDLAIRTPLYGARCLTRMCLEPGRIRVEERLMTGGRVQIQLQQDLFAN